MNYPYDYTIIGGDMRQVDPVEKAGRITKICLSLCPL